MGEKPRCPICNHKRGPRQMYVKVIGDQKTDKKRPCNCKCHEVK